MSVLLRENSVNNITDASIIEGHQSLNNIHYW